MNKTPIVDKFQNMKEKEKILNLSEVTKQFTHTGMGAKAMEKCFENRNISQNDFEPILDILYKWNYIFVLL